MDKGNDCRDFWIMHGFLKLDPHKKCLTVVRQICYKTFSSCELQSVHSYNLQELQELL